MFWLIIFILSLLIFVATAYIYGNDDYWPKQGVVVIPPSVTGSWWDRINFRIPLHYLDSSIYNTIKKIGNGALKFGGVMEFRRPVLFIMDLDLLRSIMVKDFEHFTNRRTLGSNNDPTGLHKMIFAMMNKEWKDTRAAVSPVFTTGKIRRVFGIFNETSKKLAKALREESKSAGPEGIDMRELSGRYTMDVIASAAFGVDSQNFKDKNSIFAQMGHSFQSHFNGFFGAIKLFSTFFAPEISKLLQITFLDPVSTQFFKEVIIRTIRHRELTGEQRNDFLQLLLDAKAGSLKADEGDSAEIDSTLDKGQKISSTKIEWTDELIVAQCVTFIFGGFDTTETLLTFAAYEMAMNPDIQEKLYEEIEKAVGENRELSYEAVMQMEYLDMVISETLRKYPPAGRTERKCTQDYKIPGSGVEIKKDMIVVIPIWPIHHDETYWPNPEQFIPERFSAEEKAKRHQYAYLPFGIGPRNCIAMRFAIIEGKAAIAHLIHKFHLAPSTRTTIPMKYLVTGSLKPIDGMWLKVTPRG